MSTQAPVSAKDFDDIEKLDGMIKSLKNCEPLPED